MSIGTTILAQLGGNKFVAMTGARNLIALEKGLQFDLPRNASKANRVSISLQANDTYVMHFYTVRGIKCELIDLRSDLYADQLCTVFEAFTGLATRL